MRRGLAIILLASGFFTLAAEMLLPVYAVFVQNIGGDLLTAGSAYGVFAIATGLIIFMISRWEDSVKHRERLVVVGYGLQVVGFTGYLFISVPWHLYVVAIILGIGHAINVPAMDTLYSQFLERKRQASEWGLWEGSYYIIGGISAMLGGLIAQAYGYRSLFTIMIIISIVGLLCSTMLLVGNNRKRIMKGL